MGVNVFLKIDVNLTTGILLAVVVSVAHLRLQRRHIVSRLYAVSGLMVLLMLLLESLTCILSGTPDAEARMLLQVLYALLFSAPPVLAYGWFLLSNILTSGKWVMEKKPEPVQFIPMILNGALAILSPFQGCLFEMDEGGICRRGPFYPFFLGATALYLLLGLFRLVRRRDRLLGEEFKILLLVCLLPVLGGAVQLFSGLPLAWGSAACSLIVLYIYLQEQMIQTDSLTGAWTRGPFEQHVSQLLHQDGREPFGMIYLDVDHFKSLNDQYGHLAGDEALRTLVEIVKHSIRRTDTIARLGGDEFGILVRVGGKDALEAVIRKIEHSIDAYNQTSGKPYRISCSIGSELFRGIYAGDVPSMISRVDRLMYDHKKSKRSGHSPEPLK